MILPTLLAWFRPLPSNLRLFVCFAILIFFPVGFEPPYPQDWSTYQCRRPAAPCSNPPVRHRVLSRHPCSHLLRSKAQEHIMGSLLPPVARNAKLPMVIAHFEVCISIAADLPLYSSKSSIQLNNIPAAWIGQLWTKQYECLSACKPTTNYISLYLWPIGQQWQVLVQVHRQVYSMI